MINDLIISIQDFIVINGGVNFTVTSLKNNMPLVFDLIRIFVCNVDKMIGIAWAHLGRDSKALMKQM